jgi:allophanate hydrolase subunit 1
VTFPVLHRYGLSALLVDLNDLSQVRAVDDVLRAAAPEGTTDVVPAARTVLVSFASPAARAAGEDAVARLVAEALRDRPPAPSDGARPPALPEGADPPARPDPTSPPASPTRPAAPTRPAGSRLTRASSADAPDPHRTAAPVVELPVRYDGPDLAEVAALTGLTVDEVVRRHLASRCTVAFGGFMPGFAYLTGLDPSLHVPRRDTPRERVPAGAVAVAGEFTAVYPAATPGGWRILGTCDLTLFDVHRTPPALLVPGAAVRFVREGAV